MNRRRLCTFEVCVAKTVNYHSEGHGRHVYCCTCSERPAGPHEQHMAMLRAGAGKSRGQPERLMHVPRAIAAIRSGIDTMQQTLAVEGAHVVPRCTLVLPAGAPRPDVRHLVHRDAMQMTATYTTRIVALGTTHCWTGFPSTGRSRRGTTPAANYSDAKNKLYT